MKILSIDTSSNLCTVAILEDTNLLIENTLDDTKNHSEKIMPVIANTLKSLNIDLTNIDLIVSDKGPGSFTGIRIGTATIMAFIDSLNIQAIGISSLEALAYNVITKSSLSKEATQYICSLIDAKNDNAYFAIFAVQNNNISLVEQPNCENINNIINIASNYPNITFVGDGTENYQSLIKIAIPNCKISYFNTLSSYSLGLAGLNAFKQNRKDDILPLYLRKPQAERALEDKN